jgi:hypothetical protein
MYKTIAAFWKELAKFWKLNWHEPGTSNAAILVFSMGSDIFSILWLEFITFTNSMTRWSTEIGFMAKKKKKKKKIKKSWCGNNMRDNFCNKKADICSNCTEGL